MRHRIGLFPAIRGILVLGVVSLVLGGCLPSATQEPYGRWDQDCQPQGLHEPQLPLLRSLYAPAHWVQRQETRERLHIPVPVIDVYALSQETNPDLVSIPRYLPDPLPTYNVGDLHLFRLLDADGHESWEIEAKLLHKSEISYVWLETDSGTNENYIRRLATDFDTHIYPPTLSYFGPGLPLGFDRDKRIHLLFAHNLGDVLGYFSSADGVSRQVYPRSNEKDMFFLNLDFIGDRQEDLGVLAHEFEHLIHWHYAPGERSFIDEGLAELATLRWTPLRADDVRLSGYDGYRHNPALQLNAWSTDDYMAVDRHYGSGLGFAVYLTELFGPAFAREVVAEPRRGIVGLEVLLQNRGCSFVFDDMFADFALANLVWDPLATGSVGPLGFETFAPWLQPVRHNRMAQTPLEGHAPVTGSLPPYAVHYLAAAPDFLTQDSVLVFDGSPTVSIVPDAEIQDRVMWSNRHNESRIRLSRPFDLTGLEPGQSVHLETRMWWDIEENWDFAYVMASRNGQDWVLLESEATVPRDRHGRSLGPALTGQNIPADGSWSRDRWDLSSYAGDEVWIRFDYVTDSAMTGTGWVVDEVAIDAIGYQEDFDGDMGDWNVEGWIQTANTIPMDWLVQAVILTQRPRGLRLLERRLADEFGQAQFAVPELTGDERLYLLVSPLAPMVTGSVSYTLRLENGTTDRTVEVSRVHPVSE